MVLCHITHVAVGSNDLYEVNIEVIYICGWQMEELGTGPQTGT